MLYDARWDRGEEGTPFRCPSCPRCKGPTRIADARLEEGELRVVRFTCDSCERQV